jgi:hypothetical protein
LDKILLTWWRPIMGGFLLGLPALWWIDPQTSGGTFLVIATFVAIVVVATTLGGTARLLYHLAATGLGKIRAGRRKQNRPKETETTRGEQPPAPPPVVPGQNLQG